MSRPKTRKEWDAAEREIRKMARKIGTDVLEAMDVVRRSSGSGIGINASNRSVKMIEAATVVADVGILELVRLMESVYFGE